MNSMRASMEAAISGSATMVLQELGDGNVLVQSMDAKTIAAVADAVLEWLKLMPCDGLAAKHYAAGRYSRDNVAAMVADIEGVD